MPKLWSIQLCSAHKPSWDGYAALADATLLLATKKNNNNKKSAAGSNSGKSTSSENESKEELVQINRRYKSRWNRENRVSRKIFLFFFHSPQYNMNNWTLVRFEVWHYATASGQLKPFHFYTEHFNFHHVQLKNNLFNPVLLKARSDLCITLWTMCLHLICRWS